MLMLQRSKLIEASRGRAEARTFALAITQRTPQRRNARLSCASGLGTVRSQHGLGAVGAVIGTSMRRGRRLGRMSERLH